MKLDISQHANAGGVYCIRNLVNQRIYIGSTSRFRQRAREHGKALRDGKASPMLQRDYNKCGPHAFEFSVLEVVVGDKSARLLREQSYIDRFFDGQVRCYNINKLANSRAGTSNNWTSKQRAEWGRRVSQRYQDGEYRARQCEAMKRAYEANRELFEAALEKGRHSHGPMSAETRAKLSEAKKRSTCPNPMLGKHLSDAAKRKLSASRAKTYDVKVLAPNGAVYGPITNLKQFCAEHGLNQGSMWLVVNGRQASTKGWSLLAQ